MEKRLPTHFEIEAVPDIRGKTLHEQAMCRAAFLRPLSRILFASVTQHHCDEARKGLGLADEFINRARVHGLHSQLPLKTTVLS